MAVEDCQRPGKERGHTVYSLRYIQIFRISFGGLKRFRSWGGGAAKYGDVVPPGGPLTRRLSLIFRENGRFSIQQSSSLERILLQKALGVKSGDLLTTGGTKVLPPYVPARS